MRKLVVLLCAIFIFSSCTKAEMTKAPDFSLKDIADKTINLSDYKGKIVILNFWATWCPPCKAEIPDFVRFYKAYREKGIEIIGIAVGSQKDEVLRMVEKYGINYPVCMSDGDVEKLYGGIRFVPATFIIDRTGTNHPTRPGALSEAELIKMVEPFL